MRALVTQSQGDVAELWIQEVLKGEKILFSYGLAFQLSPSPLSVLKLKLPKSQSDALLDEESYEEAAQSLKTEKYHYLR